MEKILFHKYDLIRQLGAGGSGNVFLAMDRHLERFVAIKESRESASLEEMKLLRELEHPGLPVVFDYFKERGSAWIVMEYIEGMTLRQYLSRHKRVDESQAVKWMLELCRIVYYLHDRHPAVIYRDLKPENIMIRQDGRLKLIDLGGAIRFACGRESAELCAGTEGYCPRQQWKKGRGDVSWDIYAMGMVLYEMLTGDHPAKPPYERRPLSEYHKNNAEILEKIIRNCTSEKETCRYQSVLQLEKALVDYQKVSLPFNTWQTAKRIILSVGILMFFAYLAGPLMQGVLVDQIPFPYLERPLFILLITYIFYHIFFRRQNKKRFLRRQEKNIWLTQKKFSGLMAVLLFLGSGILAAMFFSAAAPAVCAGNEPKQLWVEMRDNEGRKMLLKKDAVYIADDCVRFEIPAGRLPDEKISLQMVAVGEEGEVYSSRIFHIRAKEDLN